MSTVAVTGGTGHLGRRVVGLLKAEGHRVRVLARSPGQDSDVEWVNGDLATGDGVGEAVKGAQVVVHAATHSPAARRGISFLGIWSGRQLTSMSKGRVDCSVRRSWPA